MRASLPGLLKCEQRSTTQVRAFDWMSLLYNLHFWFLSSWLTVLKCSNNWLLSKFNSSCIGEGFCGWQIVALVGAADVVWQPLSLREDSTKELWLECVFVRVVLTSVCLCVYVWSHESQSGVGLAEHSAGWLEHAGSFPRSRQHSVPNEFSSGRAFALGHNHKAYCYRHKRGARGVGPVNGDRRAPSRMRIREWGKEEVSDDIL